MDITGAVTSTISTVTSDGGVVLLSILAVFASLLVLGLATRWVRSFIGRKK